MTSTEKYLTPSKFLFRLGLMIFMISFISWMVVSPFDGVHADKTSLAFGCLSSALLAGANYCHRRTMTEVANNLPKSVFFWLGMTALVCEACMWTLMDKAVLWDLEYRKIHFFIALTAAVSFQMADYMDPAGGKVKMRA